MAVYTVLFRSRRSPADRLRCQPGASAVMEPALIVSALGWATVVHNRRQELPTKGGVRLANQRKFYERSVRKSPFKNKPWAFEARDSAAHLSVPEFVPQLRTIADVCLYKLQYNEGVQNQRSNTIGVLCRLWTFPGTRFQSYSLRLSMEGSPSHRAQA